MNSKTGFPHFARVIAIIYLGLLALAFGVEGLVYGLMLGALVYVILYFVVLFVVNSLMKADKAAQDKPGRLD